MLKRISYLLAALAVSSLVVFGCKPENPENNGEEEEPQELEKLIHNVPVVDNWIFGDKPAITIHIENPNKVPVAAEAQAIIYTDKKVKLKTVKQAVEVPASGSIDVAIDTGELEPGFYKAVCTVSNRGAGSFTFGVRPTEIVSAPDKQEDFDSFWESTLTQLEGVDMNPQLTEITTRSNSSAKVYLLEMNSLPDGLDGEPVVIHGYYIEPQDGKKHPVIMHYYGYDDQKPRTKLGCPSGGSEYAELYLSTRGQIINNRTANLREPDGHGDFVNTYGDWFAFNFGQRDAYYYRGAFMDCVQGIRFMATRETSDMSNIFAEGKSQGGAFSYAAAALSPYPLRAIAPGVAFLGDFPDYFQIVSWPGNTAKENQGSMSEEEMYRFLSYFDTKNLATRISCSVIANLGLMDETCPPHTNMAPFNVVNTTDKEMHYYPKMGHDIPSDWESKYMKYFKARIKN